jgi:hypothetical protein
MGAENWIFQLVNCIQSINQLLKAMVDKIIVSKGLLYRNIIK